MRRRKGPSGPELIILSPETWKLVMTVTALRYEDAWRECEKERVRLAKRLESNPSLDDLIGITRRSQYWLEYWSQWSIDEEERDYCLLCLERARPLNEMLRDKARKHIEKNYPKTVPMLGRR
jgi:hypothetical protein